MRKCNIQKKAIEGKRRLFQADARNKKVARKTKKRLGQVITGEDYPSEHTRHGKGKF